MARNAAVGDSLEGGQWPPASAMGCEEFRTRLSDHIERLLAGFQPTDDEAAITAHLESCPSCSWAYIDLLDLATASQVRALMDSWLVPDKSPPEETLKGLLTLWQVQLGAAQRVDDLKAAARGLSVVGLIRRCLRDEEEALQVHQLALRLSKDTDDPVCRATSHADLGYIALSRHQTDEALDHLEKARQYAMQLTDKESETRMCLILAQAWERKGDWVKAWGDYWKAGAAALAANFSLGLELVSSKVAAVILPATAGLREFASELSSPSVEASRPLQALKQALQEIESTTGLPSTHLAPQLSPFYAGVLQVQYEFGAPGEKVLVVNTAQEIRMDIVAEPHLLEGGDVVLAIGTPLPAAIKDFPEKFFVDVLFLPAAQVLTTVLVTPDNRFRLIAVGGLTIKAKLPGFDDFQSRLRQVLNTNPRGQWDLPRTAFAFRIWWEE